VGATGFEPVTSSL